MDGREQQTTGPAPAAPGSHPDDRWFRDLAELRGDVFYALRTRPDLALEYISPTVEGLMGLSAEDLCADPTRFLQTIDPRDAEVLVASLDGEPGTLFEADLRWVHRDGRVLWGRHRARYRQREDGSVVAEGSAADITELRAAQESLARSEHQFRLVAENSADFVILSGLDGTIEWVSPSVTRILGWRPEDAVGRLGADFVHPDLSDAVRSVNDRVNEGAVVSGRTRLRSSDGSFRWFEHTTRPVADDDGGVVGRVTGFRDVTSEVEASQALALSESHFRLLAEHSSDVVLRLDGDERITWASPSSAATLRWDPARLLGVADVDLVHPADRPWFVPERARILRSGEPGTITFRIRRGDDTYVWVEAAVEVVAASGDRPAVGVVRLRDVEDQVRAFMQLQVSEQRFRLAMDSAPTGMAVIDLDRCFVEVNPALCRLLGRDEGWLTGRRVSAVLDDPDDDLDRRMRSEVLAAPAGSLTREHTMVRSDGERVWVEHSVGVLRSEDGRALSFVSQFVDVTEARRSRQRLRFLATHDALTTLVNRGELVARVEALLDRTPRTGTELGVLFVDIDNLKPVNDTHGHLVGDAVIREVAVRLREQVRQEDVVARFGGDEFVVALPGVHDIDDAQAIADKIRCAAAEPITVGAARVSVTISVGATIAVTGEDVDSVFSRADAALYRAKREGRSRVATIVPLDGLALP